jgi:hypothetical protein
VRFEWRGCPTPTTFGRAIPRGAIFRSLFARSASNLAKRAAWSTGQLAATHGGMNLVRPITRHDIKGPQIYAGIRDDYRKRVIAMKQHRRVILGDRVEIVFDNRFILTLQIEETCRLENLAREDQIEAEIILANELMPTPDSLAATLFIPLPPGADARDVLGKLVGLDEHVVMTIGSGAGSQTLRAQFEAGRSEADRISAVQYLRFKLSPEARTALLIPGTPITVEIDHPNYRHRVECPDDLRASLAADYGD